MKWLRIYVRYCSNIFIHKNNDLFGDNSKIIEHTNWKIEHTLEQGLKETINWFSDKKNLTQYKAGIYNV